MADLSTISDLRLEVRLFLTEQIAAGVFEPHVASGGFGTSRQFSRALADRGWVGMAIPREYGGGGRPATERFAVSEELLAAGAPVAAHWTADRQVAPMLIVYGTDEQKKFFLPPIARAELIFAIGMSEPESGSDLASIRTRARRTDGGWMLSGQKIWTSMADEADYAVVLCRTGDDEDRHRGMSQLIVDMRSDGIDVRRIVTMAGDAEFCEIFFDDCFVPDSRVVGEPGSGWLQVTTELGYERGGPDRYLSTFPLLEEYVVSSGKCGDRHVRVAVGELVAHLIGLRALATRVVAATESSRGFEVEAAVVKDAGTAFEQEVVSALRAADCDGGMERGRLDELFVEATLAAPHFTIRGGTTEILRGIIARNLTAR